MSKKIGIKIKNIDKLEFELIDDARKGDYISLMKLNEISFDEVRRELNNRKNSYLKEMWEANKLNYIYSSEEYKGINNNFIKVKDELNKIRSDFEIQKQDMNFQKKSYEDKINALVEQEKLKIESEINKRLAEKESKITELETEILINKNNFETEKNSLKNNFTIEKNNWNEKYNLKLQIDVNEHEREWKRQHENEIKEWEIKYNDLERRRNQLNVKNIGEDLELYLTKEASNYLSFSNSSHSKANKVIDGTKPDFIFKIFDDNQVLLQSVTVEAKSELLNSKTKTRNSDHFEKLDSDRKKNGSKYAVLVTELEKDDNFISKTIGEYKDMYLVRPQYYVTLMLLIYNLTISESRMDFDALNKLELRTKHEVLNEFNDFKADLIENTMKKIETKFLEINKQADKSIDAVQKIKEHLRKSETHFNTIKNKLDKFKLEKILKKVEQFE